MNRKARIARHCELGLDCPLASSSSSQASISRGLAQPLSKWAQAVSQAYVESSNGWAPSGRGHRHCAAAGATRLREADGSCMARPNYLHLFARPAARMSLWQATHLPSNLGWAFDTTPFLKPAHPVPAEQTTPVLVFNSCRSAAPPSRVGVILRRTTYWRSSVAVTCLKGVRE